MLTKPQAFYDNTHKQALGYQNPFYLKKVQRIKPTLHCNVVLLCLIVHVAMSVIDVMKTWILEEEIASKILTEDLGKRFSPQQELSAEQAFWFHILNPTTEPPYTPPVIVDVPSELPKSSVDKQCLEIAKKEILLENDRLLQKIMSQDVSLTVMNSMSLNNDSVNMEMQECKLYEKCLNLDAELSKSKQAYNDFLKNYSQLEKHCISLEASMQLQQEATKIKTRTFVSEKDTIQSLRENTKEENVNHDKCDLEPINKELENSVAKLLSENERKEIVENVVHTPSVTTIAPGMFKLDLVPLPPSELDFAYKYAIRIQELLVYVQDTCPNAITPSPKKVAITPMNKVKKVRFAEPLTSSSNIKQPPGNKRNDRISQTPSRNKKNKVEAQPRKLNKMNRVVKPACDVDVKHSLSNANSKILCAT
ncbi:hypothetical protein Tco_1236230 [Tanacetum coccineum]